MTRPESAVADPTPPRQPRRGRRVLLICAAIVVVLLGSVAGSAFVVVETLGSNIERIPNAFERLDGSARPAPGEGLTFLLVGTDTRSDVPTTGSEAAARGVGRSDVVMIARVDPGRTGATVVSIPRDSWVDIPGRGPGKINAAHAYGGPSLLTQTVEQLTGLRIDHFGVVDFAGFRAIVDAIGGIDVGISAATGMDGVQFRQGVNHLDGDEALTYVRQRRGLPDGDLDRGRRQQSALRAVVTKAGSGGLLADPVGAYDFLDALTRSVSVDDTLSNADLRGLAFELSALRPGAVSFLTAPVAGLGREGAQAVVYLDGERGTQMWRALREDRGADYVLRNPEDALGPVTR